MKYYGSFIASDMYYMSTYQCVSTVCMVCLSEGDISAPLSVHQYIDGGGPPYGGFWVEKTLFWLAVLY